METSLFFKTCPFFQENIFFRKEDIFENKLSTKKHKKEMIKQLFWKAGEKEHFQNRKRSPQKELCTKLPFFTKNFGGKKVVQS